MPIAYSILSVALGAKPAGKWCGVSPVAIILQRG